MGGFRVFVLDTNAVIDLKRLALADQWAFFEKAKVIARAGHIAFPRQVEAEIKAVKFPDAPGAWLVGAAAALMRYPQPSDKTLRQVLSVAEMVDPAAERDPADPYVVAMACELRSQQGLEVLVVSADKKDRPGLVSVQTACGRLGIDIATVEQFIVWTRAYHAVEQSELPL